MNKSLFKMFLRTLRLSTGRFVAICIISALGAAFLAGINATKPDMQNSLNTYFSNNSLYDINITSYTGLSSQDIDTIKGFSDIEKIVPTYALDAYVYDSEKGEDVKQYITRVYSEPSFEEAELQKGANVPTLKEGQLPQNEGECVIDLNRKSNFNIGDTITIKTDKKSLNLKISGFVSSPIYISKGRGFSTLGNGKADSFAYIYENTAIELLYGVKKDQIPQGALKYTEASIVLSSLSSINAFSSNYEVTLRQQKDNFSSFAESNNLKLNIITRISNSGFSDFKGDSDRIGNIGKTFPIIFFLVAILVTLTSMTRLVEDERTKNGTLMALGYSSSSIIFIYSLYALITSVLGSIIGVIIGFRLFPSLIGGIYNDLYTKPLMETPFIFSSAAVCVALTFGCALLSTIIAAIIELVEEPAALLRPKSPPAGKRVIVERIGFIWKRLSFTSKITMRNLLRYKIRFTMSVIGIIGCTALILTGFGLRDSIDSVVKTQYKEIYHYDMTVYYKTSMDKDAKALTDLASTQGIKDTLNVMEQNVPVISLNDKSVDAMLVVTSDRDKIADFITLKNGSSSLKLDDSGVILTKKLAQLLNVHKDENVNIMIGKGYYSVKISEITDQYVQHYVYISDTLYSNLTGEAVKYNVSFAREISTGVAFENDLGAAMMQSKDVATVSFASNVKGVMNDSIDKLSIITLVLIISAGILAFVVIYNLTNINIIERARELATIKVLGFKDFELGEYIYRENLLITIIGTGLGLIGGLFMHTYVLAAAEIDIMIFPHIISPLSYVMAAAMTIVFSFVVNAAMYKKIVNVDMIASLKSVE